jgi:Tfp pilus assembly protein PilN
MRFDLNLARDPFRNRSLFWIAVAAGYLVVLTVGFAVLARSGSDQADAERLKQEIADQEVVIAELNQKLEGMRQTETQAVMTIEDRIALDEARDLINEKSVSWSQLLAELERYVPKEAKLTSVGISSVEGSGAERVATVRVEAIGTDQGAVITMITSFDRSGGRFSAEPVRVEPTENGSEVAFELDVKYWPAIGTVAPPPAPDTPAAGEAADE